MTPIQVVGVGLDGRAGLAASGLALIDQATVLVGSPRHLSYFAESGAERWPLSDLKVTLERLRGWLESDPSGVAVVLASGDPLFFGLGRLLLEHLPPESLTFHPHLSAVQLAFSRLKLPWQEATLVSAHGRSTDALTAALRRGDELIAVLTDPAHTPAALGQLVLGLELPHTYRLWVGENLGGDGERVRELRLGDLAAAPFASLNVVVLQRQPEAEFDPANLPLIGLPDRAFATFGDRPGLITKRDVRIQVLADLDPRPGQVIWDVGAGTGSVSVEISRLCPAAQVYAIEKTAAGHRLIQQNQNRLGGPNLHPIYGAAPESLAALPDPDRVFIGGSGGHLGNILELCAHRLRPQGRMVLALATLEHTGTVLGWVDGATPGARPWAVQLRQIQVQHGVRVGSLTRWQPLTPITLITLTQPNSHSPAPVNPSSASGSTPVSG
ncbi:bifunctional cobalt-precorrin-7 (C(5))-methyltransferase/cobalt-precorrin-6B (C(15))-methyltransferase [Leptolyngbya sp. KIOST-1]|uniref:bifunctional cobalt-precorrin-7 (C(5))-methyltransferase/cobalt-precorrin-6B (C(15))-methyltransferase n=1 Tax=Leptolyngbya sp. KIOST-1 TaxID=1229172 RepID=UPI00068D491C|nr:bifunctional cobalt-precorrin-7 (C(5))-methyltransferase/cobalt-precorrin-6B (C(15))-methyltransferase [Leptolyngbya sp. KIOST-1]